MKPTEKFLLKMVFHLLIAAAVGYSQSSFFIGAGLFLILILGHWALGVLIDWEDVQPGGFLNPATAKKKIQNPKDI